MFDKHFQEIGDDKLPVRSSVQEVAKNHGFVFELNY